MKRAEKNLQKTLYIAAFIALAVAWGLWKFQHAPQQPPATVTHLRLSSALAPLSQKYLPEERRQFALAFGRKLIGSDKGTTVTTGGDFHATLLITGEMVNEGWVRRLMEGKQVIRELREMGFRKVVATNRTAAWEIDLGN